MTDRRKSIIYGAVALLIVLFVTSFYVNSTTIHGDGQLHEIITRQVLDHGWPQPDNHRLVMNFLADGSPQYAPINYPEIVYLIYALFLKIGPTALQFTSPLFAVLSAFLIYILLRPIGRYQAVLASVAAIIFNLRRFIISPLIEQPLLAAFLATLLFLTLWLDRKQYRYAILAGLSAGLTMSLKQQGLLILPIIISVLVLILPWRRYRAILRKMLLSALVMIVVAVAVTLPFQLEHFSRNGTIGYVPGAGTSGILNHIPVINNLIDNKFPADPAASEAVRSLIGYRTSGQSPADTVMTFLLLPFKYDTDVNYSFNTAALALLSLIIILLGIGQTGKANKVIMVILLDGLIMEFLFAQITQSSVWQYHVLGVASLAIFFAIGLASLPRLLRRRGIALPLKTAVISLIIGLLTISFAVNIHQPYYGNSGRQDVESVQAYGELGEYIDSHIPGGDFIITGGTNIVQYSGLNRFWISNGGGADIPEIFNTTDVELSHQLLRQYPVKYLLIDERKTEKTGLYDSLAINGLNQTIDTTAGQQYFRLLQSVSRSSGPALRLYEIL
ncbi:MAG: glycosyltransferase family 39 protein [Patescibacteria group bacterium]